MNQREVDEVIDKHALWLDSGHERGEAAGFANKDLKGKDFFDANLERASFFRADISYATFHCADLRRALFQEVTAAGANFREANLGRACFYGADLTGAILPHASINAADFRQTKGLLNDYEWLNQNLASTDEGYIAYKIFGVCTHTVFSRCAECDHTIPGLSPGQTMSEITDPTRTVLMGAGVEVGTREWADSQQPYGSPGEVWKVLIRWKWAAGIVVPYHTDGRFRCPKIEFLRYVGR